MRKRKTPPEEFFEREAQLVGASVEVYRRAWHLVASTGHPQCDFCDESLKSVLEHEQLLRELQRQVVELSEELELIERRRRSKNVAPSVRAAVLLRDGNRCRYCGKTIPDGKVHLDHVLPVNAGGEATVDNIVVACPPCNLRKSRWVLGSPRVRGMKLRPVPDSPTR